MIAYYVSYTVNKEISAVCENLDKMVSKGLLTFRIF